MLSGLYSAVSRLVSTTSSQESDSNDEYKPDPLKYPSTEKNAPDESSYPSTYAYHESPESSSSKPVAPHNIKTVQGTVTQLLSSGYGLIDNDIVFTYDDVVGKERPRIGTVVQVEAYREHSGGGWKAKRVTLSLDWNEDPNVEDPVEIQTIVGTITKVVLKTGEGFINETVGFDNDALAYGFKPCRGDWVVAELHTNPDTQQNFAKNVRPLRHRRFDGVVTHSYPGYGYIDNKIYFLFSNCENGYRPQKGDSVEGRAIESDQSKGRWRAIQVVAKKVYKRQHRATESPLQSQRMQDLERNKRGIVISSNLHLGSMVIDETKTIQVSIKNVGSIEHTLKSCEACSLSAIVSVKVYNRSYATLEANPSGKPFVLPAAVPSMSSMIAVLSVTASQLGRTSFQVIFDFGEFQIGRSVTLTVEDPQMLVLAPTSVANLKGKANKKERLRDVYIESRSNEGWVIPGRRVSRNYDVNLPVKLPKYVIPRDLEQAVLLDEDVTASYPELNQGLSTENYATRFSALLHLEEVQMQIDMRQFDLEKVSMKPRLGEYLSLEVPGLAEGRPSVLIGDKIILSIPDAHKYAPKYEGIVHEVLSDAVLLKFNEEFQESYQAEEYNVAFTFSRTPMRRCHQAAEFAKNLGMQVLFPKKVEARPPQVNITYRSQATTTINIPRIPANLPRLPSPKPNKSPYQSTANRPIRTRPIDGSSPPKADVKFLVPKISCSEQGAVTNVKQAKTSDGTLVVNFFNSKLNARQRAAVVRILQGEGRPTPYILFGPPGTGKTVTVVEAILQVHHHMPSSRILACAPSNSAADLLTERLHLSGCVKQHELIRLNSFRRSDETIPDVIRPYCTDGEELERVAHHRMLVCTCTMAGSFYQLGLKAGHFTHVFVDEAGQATEPECLIPAGLAVGAEGQIILAGDPMQLGPVLNSHISISYGLGLSLLERLIKRPLYRRDSKKFRDHGNYDPLLVTKLVENYRSHPVLLKLPSDTFYHGELEPQADPQITTSLCQWELLPNKEKCPLIFHGIKGEDMREGNSPSWFNPMEVVQVVKYLKSLLAMTEPALETSDIGIITPYRKQVEKIRMLMATLDIDGVKVGSVEEFQGQERRAMIISTVRSAEGLVNFDIQHHLGFVRNPKRFNVSITRAQALQIIVGNPQILAKDRYWRALLRYCVQQNAYIGCDLPELSDEEVIEEGDLDRTLEDVEDTGVHHDDACADDKSLSPVISSENIQIDSTGEVNQTRGETPNRDEVIESYGQVITAVNNRQQKSPTVYNTHNQNAAEQTQMHSTDSTKSSEQSIENTIVRYQVEADIGIPQDSAQSSSSPSQNLPQSVQSTEHAKKDAAFTNFNHQKVASIQHQEGGSNVCNAKDIDSTCDTKSQISPLQCVEAKVYHAHSRVSEMDRAKSSPTESSDSGIGSEQKDDGVEVVVIGHSPKESTTLQCHTDGHLLENNSVTKTIPDQSSVGPKADNKVGESKLVTATQQVQNSRSSSKSSVRNNSSEQFRKETAHQQVNIQRTHQQQSKKSQQVVSKAKQSKRETQHGGKHRGGKSDKTGAAYVMPEESEADREKRQEIINTLYHGASVSSPLPFAGKATSEPGESIQHAEANIDQTSAKKHPSDDQSQITAGGAAGCHSPGVNKSSDPAPHLSDDSGPEDFQDYTPSRSSSEHSIEEKSSHRGWWTTEQVVSTPPPPPPEKRPDSFRPVKPVAAGRGIQNSARDTHSSTPKNYYVGLGRGRGRHRQMAAQMQENSSSSSSSRSFSYGRGRIYRK